MSVTLHSVDTMSQKVAVNRAFSKQSTGYDQEDMQNPIILSMRKQVYLHVQRFMKPGSKILELNAGTGIDAMKFANDGHEVFATDLSDGMIAEIRKKISAFNLQQRVACQQISYTEINQISQGNFDYVFSNFGGLNCIDDLSEVTTKLKPLLKKNAYVTFVIMPKVCPFELLGLLKGKIISSLRRFKRNGARAHIHGEYFQTHYFSLEEVRKSFDASHFTFVCAEGLAAISPPPHRADFALTNPKLYKMIRAIDERVSKFFPFNRWADHLIITFRLK